jgi:hypothetical protein
MKSFRSLRSHLRVAAVALAAAMAFLSGAARAGCGTIVTLNPTDHWVWITIYDVGERQHLDWGWVAPHNGRSWTAGGAPTPQSYLCGSFYHVRYEVKPGKGGREPPGDVPNLFDTRMEINPQLTQSDLIQLFQSLGSLLTCVTPGAEAGCVAEWGIDETAQSGMLGVIGADSNNSVVCIKSSDDTHFWLENSGNCALRPPPGRPPKPKADVYTMTPGTARVGIGTGKAFTFHVSKNGQPLDAETIMKGTFTTDHPDIAKFFAVHDLRYRTYKAGKTTAHWQLGNAHASATIEVIKP